MNLDNEAYWLQRITELDMTISNLRHDKVDLQGLINRLRTELTMKNHRIKELELQIVEFQKKEFHTNEY